jgi:hypothetical protein
LPERLGHHQRVPVVGDDHAVGEEEFVDHHPGLAVGLDADEVGARHLGAGIEVEAEVADVGPTVGVHDHVVAMERGEARQIGDLDQPARVQAHELAVHHRHDLEPAVR